MATSHILFLSFLFHILLLLVSLPLETATSGTTEGRALLKWKSTLDFNTDVLHSWSIANLDNICWNWTENPALCGFPLTLKCQYRGEGKAPAVEDSQIFWSGFGWRSVVIGYSCGMPFGIFIGYLIFKFRKPQWLIRLILGN
ncbi:PREDICTED: uncharacterized protein LOC109169358 [Ipomoea nil]|uniref:uncharacterized protein LOC109169358 n=1 Tax=Ipomoea nil TaxID=35883 RepID=UPI000900D052|nr:PREDICTED: uncharacterized protein LOC109169358 [Ipomoea nil]